VIGILATSSPAGAQTTLLLRDDEGGAIATESGIDEGLRDSLGGSVRRLEPSLEDLALAAGCETEPSEPSCVARVAAAAGATLVVVERGSSGPSGWRIRLEVRRGSDGAHLRSLDLHCASADDCREAVVAALDETEPEEVPAEVATVSTVSSAAIDTQRESAFSEPRGAVAVERASTVAPPSAERAQRHDAHEVPVLPNVLFASSVAASLGAMVAGGIALGADQDARAAGIVRRRDEADHIVGLESTRDLSLGVGTGLAIAGACLAAAGAVAMLVEHDEEQSAALRVAAGTDGSGGLLLLGGSF
jgi:hypothetical protein